METNHAIKGHLDALILAILERGPLHGYSIIDEMRDRSEGRFDLPEGTIYPSLHRLERTGLLKSSWNSTGGRRRRVYSLTRKGTVALANGRSGWEGFARAVNSVLETRGG